MFYNRTYFDSFSHPFHSLTSMFMVNSWGLAHKIRTVSGDPNLYDRHAMRSPPNRKCLQSSGNREGLTPTIEEHRKWTMSVIWSDGREDATLDTSPSRSRREWHLSLYVSTMKSQEDLRCDDILFVITNRVGYFCYRTINYWLNFFLKKIIISYAKTENLQALFEVRQ